MPEDARNVKMDAAMKKSVRANRANPAFFSAQAETRHTADIEPVPPNIVKPAKAGGVFSAMAVVGTMCSAKLSNAQASAARNAGNAPPSIIRGTASSCSGSTLAPPHATGPQPKAIIARPRPPAGPVVVVKHQSELAFL